MEKMYEKSYIFETKVLDTADNKSDTYSRYGYNKILFERIFAYYTNENVFARRLKKCISYLKKYKLIESGMTFKDFCNEIKYDDSKDKKIIKDTIMSKGVLSDNYKNMLTKGVLMTSLLLGEVFMDTYTIMRIFKKFNHDEKDMNRRNHPDYAQNIIVHCGYVHFEEYVNIMKFLQFDYDENWGEKITPNCYKITKIRSNKEDIIFENLWDTDLEDGSDYNSDSSDYNSDSSLEEFSGYGGYYAGGKIRTMQFFIAITIAIVFMLVIICSCINIYNLNYDKFINIITLTYNYLHNRFNTKML